LREATRRNKTGDEYLVRLLGGGGVGVTSASSVCRRRRFCGGMAISETPDANGQFCEAAAVFSG
jgi:hypothetical protein